MPRPARPCAGCGNPATAHLCTRCHSARYNRVHQAERNAIVDHGARCHWCPEPAAVRDHLDDGSAVPACVACNTRRSHGHVLDPWG